MPPDDLDRAFAAHLARAAGDLAAGRAAAVPYAGMPGAYQLAPDGDDVTLTGDAVPATRLPRAALILAVRDAALRWISDARAGGDATLTRLADDVAAAVSAGGLAP